MSLNLSNFGGIKGYANMIHAAKIVFAYAVFVFGMLWPCRVICQSKAPASLITFINNDEDEPVKQKLSVYIDGKKHCVVPHQSYVNITVDSGEHTFFAAFPGTRKLKKKMEEESINVWVAPGQTYYFLLIVNMSRRYGITCTAILEDGAKKLMRSAKIVDCKP